MAYTEKQIDENYIRLYGMNKQGMLDMLIHQVTQEQYSYQQLAQNILSDAQHAQQELKDEKLANQFINKAKFILDISSNFARYGKIEWTTREMLINEFS